MQVEPTFANAFVLRDRREALREGGRAFIAAWRGPGTLLVVTHGENIAALTGRTPATAEIVVVAPGAGGALREIGARARASFALTRARARMSPQQENRPPRGGREETSMKRRTLLQAASAAARACPAWPSRRPIPTKPIRYIVPVAAGGGNDMIARVVTERWGRLLGQNFVVDNQSGGGGVVAS